MQPRYSGSLGPRRRLCFPPWCCSMRVNSVSAFVRRFFSKRQPEQQRVRWQDPDVPYSVRAFEGVVGVRQYHMEFLRPTAYSSTRSTVLEYTPQRTRLYAARTDACQPTCARLPRAVCTLPRGTPHAGRTGFFLLAGEDGACTASTEAPARMEEELWPWAQQGRVAEIEKALFPSQCTSSHTGPVQAALHVAACNDEAPTRA